MKDYGITKRNLNSSNLDYHLENLKIRGYSIEPNALSIEDCYTFSKKLENIYLNQEAEFGRDNLIKINELDICRLPLAYDKTFSRFFSTDLILTLASEILGNNFQLHLQNGIINRPNREHHQSSWHRDLPYQDWVISKPLAFNAFYCLSDFNSQNGATFVLPHSHKLDFFPSEIYVSENEIQLHAKKGSIIFFDSMLFHRAGINVSSETRYGLNNMFVVPILKQQILTSTSTANLDLSEDIVKVLGHNFDVPSSVLEFRNNRLKKISK
jgi:hypothetical protein